MPKKPDTSPLLAMVALNSPKLAKLSRILAAFRKRCPDASEPSKASQDGNSISFHLGDVIAVIGLIPAPIPWTDLEGPCATAWWWPEATERMHKHNSHAIVSVIGGEASPASRHILLTNLVCAVANQFDSAGIYWGAGTVVHEAKAFEEVAAELSPDNLTPQLWVDMRLEQQEDGSFRYFTTGMVSFDCLEIEIDKSNRSPEEILDFGYDIVKYVLTRGASIKHGETVGRSADERFKVLHKPSMFKRGTVMKLAFG